MSPSSLFLCKYIKTCRLCLESSSINISTGVKFTEVISECFLCLDFFFYTYFRIFGNLQRDHLFSSHLTGLVKNAQDGITGEMKALFQFIVFMPLLDFLISFISQPTSAIMHGGWGTQSGDYM